MKRNIKKQFWMNREEATELRRKARKTGLSEASLVRQLILGFLPRELPDERFYNALRQMESMEQAMQKLAGQTAGSDKERSLMLRAEIDRLHRFQLRIEKEFLTPGEMRWQ